MRYQHIIWDFDGTLFNTYPPLNHAIRRAAADLGAAVMADRVARLLNQTLAQCIETIAMDYGLDRATFEQRIDEHHARVTPEEQPPMPGALEVCARIKAAGGANYIFTHRSRETLDPLLEWYQVRPLFKAVVSAHDGFPRKPNGAGFLDLMKRFQLSPDQVLAVGDRQLDVLAANNAGIAACLLTSDYTLPFKVTHTIHHLNELADVLELP